MLILFDIDDTLLDHSAAMRSGAMRLHKSLGAPGLPEDFLGRWQRALERHYARYVAGEVSFHGQRRARVREVVDSSLSDKAADRIFGEYAAGYEDSWALFGDVMPCLDSLSRHRLGVISNGQGRQQRKKLARTRILDRFECVLISDECGCAKPDAGIFASACARVGERPANAVYVGDQYDLDALAARAAGLRGVWLDRHQSATAQQAPPIIGSLVRLQELLSDG
jgi:putative hydrolase of the HAD superfamily